MCRYCSTGHCATADPPPTCARALHAGNRSRNRPDLEAQLSSADAMTTLRRRRCGASSPCSCMAVSAPPTVRARSPRDVRSTEMAGPIASPYVLVFRFDEELKADGTSVTVRDSYGTRSGNEVARDSLARRRFTQVVDTAGRRTRRVPGALGRDHRRRQWQDAGRRELQRSVTATPSPAPRRRPPQAPTYSPAAHRRRPPARLIGCDPQRHCRTASPVPRQGRANRPVRS
jgi:hypothetical protein